MLLGATLTIVGVLNFLLIVALFVLLVVGLKYLFGLIGWSVPQPIWTVNRIKKQITPRTVQMG